MTRLRLVKLMSVLVVFLSMVSSIMGRSVSISRTPYEMERKIKLFLTNIHNLDVTMNITLNIGNLMRTPNYQVNDYLILLLIIMLKVIQEY